MWGYLISFSTLASLMDSSLSDYSLEISLPLERCECTAKNTSTSLCRVSSTDSTVSSYVSSDSELKRTTGVLAEIVRAGAAYYLLLKDLFLI